MGGFKHAADESPYGRRTLNSTLESIVRETPDKIFSLVPKTEDLKDGFKTITYQELINGVSAAAYWLDQHLGKLPQVPASRQTIAYIGPNDLRYLLLILGADRSNRSLLVPLMFNSPEAQVRLIDRSKTVALLAPQSHLHAWDKVQSERPDVSSKVMPELDFFLKEGPHYPYDQDIADFWNSSPFLIQTSGTTGFPKPLHQTNAAISVFDMYGTATMRDLPLDQQHCALSGWKDKTTVNCMPVTWIAGIFIGLMAPLFMGTIAVVPPASMPNPPTFEIIKQIRELVPDISCICLIPSLIRDIMGSEGGPEFVASLDLLWFAGAPLDEAVGNAIVKHNHTRINCIMGSTEAGPYDYLVNPDLADWSWMNLNLSGAYRLEHFSDNLYELVLDKEPDRSRSCFLLHPELEVYRTADLFNQHPEKKHLWRPAGRADDFVKLQSMTKFNAIDIERTVDRYPEIARCIVGGDDRTASFIILQAAFPSKYANTTEMLDAMWPGVEKANESIFPEARLTKGLAIVTSSEKPLTVTQKGTTERRKGIAAYANEIEAIYKEN
ncbi:acetyl-CoA synthetase-like protein, partial [Myriangium duriaei CBS 260.36]